MATDWDKFVASPEHLADGGAPGSAGTPHGPEAGEMVLPELVVTLEVLLDVRDIARLDMAELWPLKRALSGVDREASVASWTLAEPAAITEWREGVAQRALRSDVAAAILHALEPYHALVRRTHVSLPTVAVRLAADRVIAIRRNAVMLAWFEQVKQIVRRDKAEHRAWLRYWITVNSPSGTREDTVLWQRGTRQRAEAGSEVARRVIDSVLQRDRALAELDRPALHSDPVVHVPGITGPRPPAAPPMG